MRFFLPHTIQARLILSHLLVSLASVALIASYAGQILYSAVRQQAEHRYEVLSFAAARDVEGSLIDYLSGQSSNERVRQSLARIFSSQPEVHYTIYLPDGIPLMDSSGNLPPAADPQTRPELWEALSRQTGEGEVFRRSWQGEEFLYLVTRIEREDQVYGLLSINIPLEAVLKPARSSLLLLIGFALIIGLVMSVAGFFLARSLAEPIEQITHAAESLTSDKMSARFDSSTNLQEINLLAVAFNNMAARLESYVNELRSFVANASHELRTPLTSIKLRVEALRNGALDDPPVSERFLGEVESEVDRMSSMVNDLLDLSRIETGLDPSRHEPVDLATITYDVFDAFKVRAERAEIQLGSSIHPDLPPVMGNEEQLRRMLYNLVDNAVKYTARNGRVEISLEVNEQGGNLLLKVSDTGYGIAPVHLPHLFERFYRVEATRPRYGPSTGSGLGLPIAKSIIEAHGGKIGVDSQLGQGTVFWVELSTLKMPISRANMNGTGE